MDNFLTALCDHHNNPDGASPGTVVATDIAIMPIDPAAESPTQDYPNEKLFKARQTFTKYAAFQPGDELVSGGITYTVRHVNPWAAQGGMDAYYHILIEEASGS